MNTSEIPSELWMETLDIFGRLHHGKPAEVNLVEPGGEPKPYAKSEPLIGLIDERHGRADEVITLMLNGSAGPRSFSIVKPTRMSLCEWNDASSAELTIDFREGEQVVIRVGPPGETIPPGMLLDGEFVVNPP